MSTHRPLLRIAQAIYQATPFRSVRQAGFSAYASLVRHRVVQADVDGARYELHLGEMIDLALYLQQFELDVRAAIRRVTRPGMTVLDIGANVGAHTLLFSSLVGQTGRVVAFEPTDFAFAKLQKNVSLNPGLAVEAVRVALADHTAGRQEVDFRSSWQSNGARVNGTTIVDMIRLDEWADQHRLSGVDLIKLDVDGYEHAVIVGAQRTISRSRPTFIIEATGQHFAEPDRNPFDLLDSLGYELWDIDEKRRLSVQAVGAELSPEVLSINLIAKPVGRGGSPEA